MAAVYIGVAMSVPKPYWAMPTVHICSQPLSGATRSKAAFRVVGTLVGAIAAVVLVPTLVNEPTLLVGALSLWVAGCLYLSLLDRSPRSYTFMLSRQQPHGIRSASKTPDQPIPLGAGRL